MAIGIAYNSMNDTTRRTITKTVETEDYLWGQEKKWYSGLSELTPALSGENSLTTADSKELTAPSSEMKAPTKAANSFDRRMQLLIASGLIAGITPLSIRQGSTQRILDIAFLWPDGSDAE